VNGEQVDTYGMLERARLRRIGLGPGPLPGMTGEDVVLPGMKPKEIENDEAREGAQKG